MRLLPRHIRWAASVIAAVAAIVVATTANAALPKHSHDSALRYHASALVEPANSHLLFGRFAPATTTTTSTSTTTTPTTAPPAQPAAEPVAKPAAKPPAKPPVKPAPKRPAVTPPVLTSNTGVDPFTDSWDVPLSNNAVLSDSSTIVANFSNEIQDIYGSVAVNGGIWDLSSSAPQYNGLAFVTVPANQPDVPITAAPDASDPSRGCNDFNNTTGAGTGPEIPIPTSASGLVSGTGDSDLVIYQPSTSTEWELWQADYSAGRGWTACDGGKLTNLATSTGTFPSSGGWGLAASGISYLGTVITEADVESGSIDHVIAMDANVGDCNGFVAPATRGDCAADPGQVSEGSMLRFPAGLAMPAGMTPFAQMVFKAIQTYGAVITDQSGGVSMQTENGYDWINEGHTGTDPITASWDGKAEYSALSGMPWNQLQVIAPS